MHDPEDLYPRGQDNEGRRQQLEKKWASSRGVDIGMATVSAARLSFLLPVRVDRTITMLVGWVTFIVRHAVGSRPHDFVEIGAEHRFEQKQRILGLGTDSRSPSFEGFAVSCLRLSKVQGYVALRCDWSHGHPGLWIRAPEG